MRQQIEALVFVISVLSGPCSAAPPHHEPPPPKQPTRIGTPLTTSGGMYNRGAAAEFRRSEGCYDADGNLVETGTLVIERYDPELQRCYGFVCDVSGQWVNVDSATCFARSLEPLLKKGLAALNDKQNYNPGMPQCYGVVCADSGYWVEGTITPCYKKGPRALEDKEVDGKAAIAKREEGCDDDGALYPTGTVFTEGYNPELQRCYGVLCDVSGQWVNVDNAPCFLKKGLAALEDKEGYDPEKRRCYGIRCDASGQWLNVDHVPCFFRSLEKIMKKGLAALNNKEVL